MRRLGFFLLLVSCPLLLWGEPDYSIVFVHIGQALPSYLEIALAQARLFNPDAPIILIASQQALVKLPETWEITLVAYESLASTPEHDKFRNRTKLNDQILDGYWRYTSERFLYLYDYMVASGARHLFHIENDVLLYANLGDLLPIFQKRYPGIATTFESEHKCIPGFVFISDEEVMQKLANYFAIQAFKAMLDMRVIALFWKAHREDIACLPMIMESYIADHTPASVGNRLLREKQCFCCHAAEFNSIFDGAAIGVFFDGLDPDKGDFHPGQIMKGAFDPSQLEYKWEEDEQGRRVPYAIYAGEEYRINNLHIASKRLQRFTSKPWPWP